MAVVRGGTVSDQVRVFHREQTVQSARLTTSGRMRQLQEVRMRRPSQWMDGRPDSHAGRRTPAFVLLSRRGSVNCGSICTGDFGNEIAAI